MDWLRVYVLIQVYIIYLIKASQLPETQLTRVSENWVSKTERLITFTIGTTDVSFSVKRNPNVDANVPVLVSKNQKIIDWTAETKQHRIETFVDVKNQAEFIVKFGNTRKHSKKYRQYFGTFRYKGGNFVLEPTDSRGPDAIHIIRRQSKKSKQEQEYVDEVTGKIADRVRDLPQGDTPYGYGSSIQRQVYTVELLVAMDYSIYNMWLHRSPAEASEQKIADAINNMRFYYAHVVNGMDMRYQSLAQPDFVVNIRLAGFYIAATPRDSAWTEDFTEVGNDTLVYSHAYSGLREFERWLDNNQISNRLPSFDHAILFTSYVLFGGYYDDGGHRKISGLTEIYGICTYGLGSIIQDDGLYGTIQTATHELAHSLGALHDGDQNNCSSSEQYIMAAVPGALDDSTVLNAFVFSNCSIDAIRFWMHYLTSEDRNCLLNTAEHAFGEEFNRHLTFQPGQIYSLDEQCRQQYGNTSFYCRVDTDTIDACRSLYCYMPHLGGCFTTNELRAQPGTVCGDRKWCKKGSCTFDSDAPTLEELCVRGDFRGRFHLGERSCEEVVKKSPWQCYNSPYQTECCESCLDIRDPYDAGCEYGDHAKWCKKIEPFKCYKHSFACCASCSKIRQYNRDDCPYGDRVQDCSRRGPSSCYQNATECCDSCRRNSTGIEGCEYGDHDDTCIQADCNNPNNWNRCCLTCLAQFSGKVGPGDISENQVIKETDNGSNHEETEHSRSEEKRRKKNKKNKKDRKNKKRATESVILEAIQTTTEIPQHGYEDPYDEGPAASRSGQRREDDRHEEDTNTETDNTEEWSWWGNSDSDKPTEKPEDKVEATESVELSSSYARRSVQENGENEARVAGEESRVDDSYDYYDETVEPIDYNLSYGDNYDVDDDIEYGRDNVDYGDEDETDRTDDNYNYNYGDSEEIQEAYEDEVTTEEPPTTEYPQYSEEVVEGEEGDGGAVIIGSVDTSDGNITEGAVGPSTPDEPEEERCSTDNAYWCAGMLREDCYNSDDVCCASCDGYRTSIPNCEYGDRANWCPYFVSRRDHCMTNNNGHTCCLTCQQYLLPGDVGFTEEGSGAVDFGPAGPPGPPGPDYGPPGPDYDYGPPGPPGPGNTFGYDPYTGIQYNSCERDDANWCQGMPGYFCYDPSVQTTCCFTCPWMRIGPVGCEYGDRSDYCATLPPEQCEYNRDTCCYTCGGYNYGK